MLIVIKSAHRDKLLPPLARPNQKFVFTGRDSVQGYLVDEVRVYVRCSYKRTASFFRNRLDYNALSQASSVNSICKVHDSTYDH